MLTLLPCKKITYKNTQDFFLATVRFLLLTELSLEELKTYCNILAGRYKGRRGAEDTPQKNLSSFDSLC